VYSDEPIVVGSDVEAVCGKKRKNVRCYLPVEGDICGKGLQLEDTVFCRKCLETITKTKPKRYLGAVVPADELGEEILGWL